jgi:exodeoxyribonuclease VII large subunit
MQQLDLFEPTPATWTVSQLNQRLRELIETQGDLQDIWIQGELSNFSRPKSGHWYFTLKDESAELRCVMWRSLAENQAHVPVDGEALEVHGAISVYEARGQYQLYADEIRPAGEGALYQEFLRLKARLEAEGLFAAERKRPIPAQPNRIGIVTSPTGAALRDMLNTLGRRYPLAEIVLAPAAVQGPAAAAELVAALNRLNQFAQPDVILLGRGGGSLEDLAAFNDEALARAIVASAAPVISGVGHETDFSISDFAADLRAPTPTAAAELATPDKLELAAGLVDLQLGLARGMQGRVQEQRWALAELDGRLERRSPHARIREDRQRVDDLLRRGERALRGEARVLRSQLEGRQARLAALNPAAILGRGFAVVSKGDGRVVRAAQDVAPGEELDVRVQDGRFGVRVENGDQD